MRVGWRAARLVDTSHPQLVGEPALAVAARAQRARLGHRVDAVVHIAELSKSVGQLLQIGRAAHPPALPNLAREILSRPRAGRRIFADISEGELLQSVRVERDRLAAGPGQCLHALFGPQSLPKGKAG